jgi:exodeoxyribonuclease V alpha subunit
LPGRRAAPAREDIPDIHFPDSRPIERRRERVQRGKREPITVVGHAAVISAGEFIQASGEWANDRSRVFRARFLKTMPPATTEGIEKYLGSGMIRGIGPAYACKLVRAFGSQVFDVIEAEPHRLREVATGV